MDSSSVRIAPDLSIRSISAAMPALDFSGGLAPQDLHRIDGVVPLLVLWTL